MGQWYYQVAGEQRGPVSLEELKKKAADGEIDRESLVREGSDGSWGAAGELLEGVQWPVEASEVAGEPGDLDAVISMTGEAAEGEKAGEEERGVRRSPLYLHPCMDCGTMVSRQARACPRCGRLFHESSMTVRYAGEHPVPVLAFFSILALVFLFLSPTVVYMIAVRFVRQLTEEGQFSWIPLLVTVVYVACMIACAVLGGAVGRPRMAYVTGLFLGLFFGPLGVFAAFSIDKRPQCCHCSSRLDGLARECPHCHARLTWKVEPSWY